MDLAELHLPRSVAYVGLARSIVASAARLAGLGGDRLEDLKIAVSESATHAVTAAQRDAEPLVLAFGPHEGAFEVHVLSPEPARRDPAVEALREWPDEGGLGLTLVEGLADAVLFPDSAHHQMVLRFDLPARTDVPEQARRSSGAPR
ncbi:MAG TPA: ATP-binding protein [Egibacteraceae bacterium]|nr:ATP-binding protein [Egibacteraceae bacterium]